MGAPPGFQLTWREGVFTVSESVPLGDRGFRYGLALFETLRIARGRALFVPEHLERLRLSAGDCGWWSAKPFPPGFEAATRELLDGRDPAWTLPPEGIARLHLTAGDGGFTDVATDARIYLTVEARPAPAPELYQRGIRVMAPRGPMIISAALGLKTHNYWPQLTALRRARAAGFEEQVLATASGEIVGFCLGNLFLVRGGEVQTPRLESGTRPGVTRAWVLEELAQAREALLTVEDLETAEEVFLTNSGYGIMPVTAVETRTLPVGRFARELIARFEALS